MAGKVARFLEEARAGPKRTAETAPGDSSKPKQPRLLLPVTLQLDHGREAREQLLWRLGDASANPAAAARAFVAQHVQQPPQAEREAERLQRDLEKLAEQHKDAAAAPTATTLVKLELRIKLPHLEALFLDDPLWDLAAPRAACEGYTTQVCNEMGLDWTAHTLILRRMKDAIDAAAKSLAAGTAQVVPTPCADQLRRSEPSRLPRVVCMTAEQAAALRQELARRAAASGGGAAQPSLSPEPPSPVPNGGAAASAAVAAQVKTEQEAEQGGAAAVAAGEAPGADGTDPLPGAASTAADSPAGGEQQAARPTASEATASDMPDLPLPDDD